MIFNPLFHTDSSISDSLKSVRKSVLIYETIIDERYTECFQKEYEVGWEKFDNKTVDDSEGIIEYTYIPIYDFSDGYDYQEKAFLNALSDLNLVLLHPGRDMFNY